MTALIVLLGSAMLCSSGIYIAKHGFEAYLFKLDELMDKVWPIDPYFYGDEK